MFLPDVNVWVALAFEGHSHHASARAWFEGTSSGDCCFCRFTQQGLLRLATSSLVVGRRAVTLVKAWRIYDAFLNDPRVRFAEEPDNLEPDWRSYTHRQTRSPKLVNDAYLAAFAKGCDYEVVSFDKAFSQFKGIRCTILS